MVRTFKSVERARKHAKKIGGKVYNYPKGYSDKRLGHLVVKRK